MSATGSRVGRRALAAGLIGLAALLAPRSAAAQPRLDVTVSGAWWNGYDLGQGRASITGPQTPTGSPVTLFDTDAAIVSGPGAELRLGWRLFRGVYAEATGGLGVNTIEARVSGDIEEAPALTVSSTLTQIAIEGGGLIDLPALRLSAGNLVPFVDGGGGYLRQVHEKRLLIETGRDDVRRGRAEMAFGGRASARAGAASRGAGRRAVRVAHGRRRRGRRTPSLHYR